ncbi:MAG TPA: ATP-binding protein [Fibrobacteria bacterium]|nr:ATP-binding protein [Fibrobacteria bacterium]
MTDFWKPLIRDLVERRRIPEVPPGITRDVSTAQLTGKATVIIGVRRSGKSTLLAQRMAELRRQGVPRSDILYLDFFDERLAGFGPHQFQDIVDAFLAERGRTEGSGRVHAFFDEIQETKGWEGFVHRAQQHLGWQIHLTGSSSRMLSKEMATQMRGRSLSHELFPFSFREFLRAGNLPETADSDEAKALIERACEEFLEEGGFPEINTRQAIPRERETIRTRIHQEYFSSIVQRDLILRNDAGHPVAIRDLTHKLIHDNACIHSLNRLTEMLKAAGHSVSKTFVSDCLEWMHDAFLFFPVPIHAHSMTKRRANPNKWYCVDTGLVGSIGSKFTADRGRMLETMVFLALRRNGIAPSYHRTPSGKEIDFVYKGSDGRMRLIQVCWAMGDPATLKRETSAMEEGISELKPSEAVIVSWQGSGTVQAGGRKIEIQPAWRFLLDPAKAA